MSNTRELGLDEIHYVALNALATLMIYVKIKNNLLVQDCGDFISDADFAAVKLSETKFIVDYSCPEIVSDILELNQCNFTVMKKGSYKGSKN